MKQSRIHQIGLNGLVDFKPREECAVAGVYVKDPNDKNTAAVRGITALLHMDNRGDQSSGAVVYNPKDKPVFREYRAFGTPAEVFKMSFPKKYDGILNTLEGRIFIGHNRYTTSGFGDDNIIRALKEIQPFHRNHGRAIKRFAFAFNGNIENYLDLKKKLETGKSRYIFDTDVDTEVMMHSLSRYIEAVGKIDSKVPLDQMFVKAATEWIGAYSLVYLDAEGRFAAVKDPIGFQPLAYGENESLIAVASESFALEKIGIKRTDINFLENGEILTIGKKNKINVKSYMEEKPTKRLCDFNFSYFAKKHSMFDNISIDTCRVNQGKELAKHDPEIYDLISKYGRDKIFVVGIPDSGILSGMGYAHKTGLKYLQAIEANPGRTFIQKTQKLDLRASQKYNIRSDMFEGKIGILVDDSHVKGNALKLLADFIYENSNPKELHARFAHPPVRFPCYDGVDIPNCDVLSAAKYDDESINLELAKKYNLKSVRFNTVESLANSIGLPLENLCTGCTTGNYPTKYARDKFVRENKNYKHLLK
jgi:amidophosphoribosyltransferase